ncbi:MAG: hypothetical protein HFH45_01265 [Bacilli bacterium]|nr:hypothetical protein [Bacilli bacterium]
MKYLVAEDGTVIEEINENENLVKVKTGDRVVRSASIEYLEDTVPIKIKFIKLNPIACNELYEYGSELFSLFQYVDFQTGILRFSNGRRIRSKHLAGILRKKRRSGGRIIEELIEKDVIHKHKEGKSCYYTMNPYLCLKGKRVTKSLYEDFRNTKYRNIEWEF